MSHPVIHDEQQQRFFIALAGEEAQLRYQWLDAHTVEAYSTYVPPGLRGQGLAELLVRSLHDWVSDRQLQLVPSCSYVASWMKRHADRG